MGAPWHCARVHSAKCTGALGKVHGCALALCTGALGIVHGCTSGRGKKKRRSWYTLSSYTAKDNKNDMGKYTTDPLRTGREIEKADALGTLGGEFGLC